MLLVSSMATIGTSWTLAIVKRSAPTTAMLLRMKDGSTIPVQFTRVGFEFTSLNIFSEDLQQATARAWQPILFIGTSFREPCNLDNANAVAISEAVSGWPFPALGCRLLVHPNQPN